MTLTFLFNPPFSNVVQKLRDKCGTKHWCIDVLFRLSCGNLLALVIAKNELLI